MWDRKVLKEIGKSRYRANRVTCIFAGFLLALVSGGTSGISSAGNTGQTLNQMDVPPEVVRIVVIVLGSAAIIGILLSIFLFNPLEVGLRRFFWQNSKEDGVGLSKDNLGVAFSEDYTNIVAAMFMTKFFAFLWSFLFIIPGIVKAYSWRLVPYIISEEPDITGTEARERSAQMMYGSRWKAFVLDLSFLGWALLGVLTLGILNIVWTDPYKAATDAELFRYLSGDPSVPAAVAEAIAAEEAPEVIEARVYDNDDEADDSDDVTFVK